MPEESEILVSQANGITVSACPVLVDHRAPGQFLWGYYLCIENNTDGKIQLLGKDWKITDESGKSYNDCSLGFKGEMPELNPGEYFEFTSETPLDAANAVFYGSCQIRTEGDQKIKEIRIPTFSLSAPGLPKRLTLH